MRTIDEVIDRVLHLEMRLAKLEALLGGAGHSPGPAPEAPRAEAGADAFPELIPTDQLNAPEPARIRPPPSPIHATAALEKIPHLMQRLLLMWHQPGCEEFLDKLLVDDRGNRRGFPSDVVDELLMLIDVNGMLGPQRMADAPRGRATDVWNPGGRTR